MSIILAIVSSLSCGVQVEMAGSSIFEYIHSHDHKELAEQLGLNQPKPGSSFYAPLGSDSSDEGSSTPNPPRSSTPSLSERGAYNIDIILNVDADIIKLLLKTVNLSFNRR